MRKIPESDDMVPVATSKSGQPVDTQIVEDLGVAFDPATQHLDLSKEEKRRTTALMLAIQGYRDLIIKDAEMYIAISGDRRRDGLPPIKEATIHAIVAAAMDFDAFISGQLKRPEPKAAILPEPEEATEPESTQQNT